MRGEFEYISYDETTRLQLLEKRAQELEAQLSVFSYQSKGDLANPAEYGMSVTATRQQVSSAAITATGQAMAGDAREREQLLHVEISERRWAIFRSLIDREPMAAMIGAIVLVALATTLIIGTFTHTAVPDTVTSAFLLVLGYFFGQNVPKPRGK
jgi:hypothetical protein